MTTKTRIPFASWKTEELEIEYANRVQYIEDGDWMTIATNGEPLEGLDDDALPGDDPVAQDALADAEEDLIGMAAMLRTRSDCTMGAFNPNAK